MIKQFKIRCSAIGQIMGKPKTKAAQEAGGISQTAETYCQKWAIEQIYDRKKDYSSKYTDKGLIMEDNSLDYIAEQQGLSMLIKNEQYFENDYMTGTPDAILPELIKDVKNSWDCFTFPLFETDIPNITYWWQGQGYMELVNKDNYELIYVLSDTPLHLIEKEAHWYCKNNGYGDLTQDIYDDFVKKMTYKGIEDKYKIKIFPFKKDIEAIKQIEQQVIKCRNYIKTLNY